MWWRSPTDKVATKHLTRVRLRTQIRRAKRTKESTNRHRRAEVLVPVTLRKDEPHTRTEDDAPHGVSDEHFPPVLSYHAPSLSRLAWKRELSASSLKTSGPIVSPKCTSNARSDVRMMPDSDGSDEQYKHDDRSRHLRSEQCRNDRMHGRLSLLEAVKRHHGIANVSSRTLCIRPTRSRYRMIVTDVAD